MRKGIDIKIPYNNKGEELFKVVKISFTSNGTLRDYNLIAQAQADAVSVAEELSEQKQEIGWIATDSSKSYVQRRALVKPIKERIKELQKELKAQNHKNLLKDRFNLIVKILDDNGITDPDLHDYDFWDQRTEQSAAWNFLALVAMKDMSSGKKKVSSILTKSS